MGIFGIITPFNFNFMVPLWFAPYAVATGNCVVMKPSSKIPFTQLTASLSNKKEISLLWQRKEKIKRILERDYGRSLVQALLREGFS